MEEVPWCREIEEGIWCGDEKEKNAGGKIFHHVMWERGRRRRNRARLGGGR